MSLQRIWSVIFAIKRFIQNSQEGRKKSDRDMTRIKRKIVKRPFATSNDIFMGMGLSGLDFQLYLKRLVT